MNRNQNNYSKKKEVPKIKSFNNKRVLSPHVRTTVNHTHK